MILQNRNEKGSVFTLPEMFVAVMKRILYASVLSCLHVPFLTP